MFSKSTEYALRATIYIARESSLTKRVGINEIATAISAPRSFTAKILQRLTNKKTGFISSVPGPAGGFYMTEEAKQNSVYKIVELMGDQNIVEGCLLGFGSCSDETPCSIHHAYKPLKIKLLGILHDKKIEELAQSKESQLPFLDL